MTHTATRMKKYPMLDLRRLGLRLRTLPGPLDVVRRLLQDLGDPPDGRIIGAPAPGMAEGIPGEAGELALQLANGTAGEVAHGFPHPVHDLLDHVLVLLEVGNAFRRDLVDLAAVRLHGADVALVFQQLQRGIDGAGRRGIAAGHPLLQRLAHFIPVPRLFLEEAEDHELDRSRLEHLPAPAAPALPARPAPEPRAEGKPLPEIEPFAMS